MTRAMVERLLYSISPTCFLCSRPATHYERLGYRENAASRRHVCHIHVSQCPGSWSKLPNAEAIEAAVCYTERGGDEVDLFIQRMKCAAGVLAAFGLGVLAHWVWVH